MLNKSKVFVRIVYLIIVILIVALGWYFLERIEKHKFTQSVVSFTAVASTAAEKKQLLHETSYPMEMDIDDSEIKYEGITKFKSGTLTVYEDKVIVKDMTNEKLCANGYTDKLKITKGNCK